jgi:putative ABC transport system permease protein
MNFVPSHAGDVVSRRTGRPHTSMFVRMLLRAAVLRRGRAASALLAMVVAAAAATAMLNLYADVQAKLRKEFRSYGANVVVVGKDGTSLPADALSRIDSMLAGRGIAVPFAYIVARTQDGQSVVVAGTDFKRVQKLNHWWSVTAWPEQLVPGSGAADALVGMRAKAVVSPNAKPFELSFQGHRIHIIPAGTLQTGAAEDSRIYLGLPEFESWTRVKPSTVEIAANGSPDEIDATIQRLQQALPTADVRPLRQIVEAEGRVLGKTRAALLAAAVLIILTAALCVLATLMGWVFDRRRDFAIMKALGASERLLNSFFAAEAAALGVVGALLGFVIGIGIAAWIGHANFHATVVPRISVLPVVLAGSVAVALLSAAVPIGLLRRVQPAMILRGE